VTETVSYPTAAKLTVVTKAIQIVPRVTRTGVKCGIVNDRVTEYSSHEDWLDRILGTDCTRGTLLVGEENSL
jgi:hypothetical protein